MSTELLEATAAFGRSLIDGVPDSGLLIVDVELRILLFDGAAYRDLDHSTVAGRRVRDVVAGCAWDVLAPRYSAALGGQVQSFRHDAVLDSSVYSVRLVPIRNGATVVAVMAVSEDITARVDTAGGLFQATLDSLGMHVAVLDEHGKIIMVNRGWVEFTAANHAEPARPGDNYLAVCDHWAPRAAAGLRSVMSGEQARFSMEYLGSTDRWFILSASRFEGPGDGRVVVSHEDVTTLHRAEGKAGTQAALLDEVDVAVIATDPTGHVTHWNRGAEDLYGWTVAEALGQSAAELTFAPGADDGHEFVAGLLDEGSQEGEVIIRRKDGSTLPVYLRGRVMLDADGGRAGRIVVSVDMSERVASERALLAAHNYMQAVADSMGEGLFTLDTEGRVIYMNEAAEKLLKWSSGDLEGRVLHHIAHFRRPDGTPATMEDSPIQEASREGMTVRVDDDIFIRRDGSELPVAYTASPFETEEGVQGCAVVFEEISERKAQEERLRREADKLSWISRIQHALAQDRFELFAQPIIDLGDGKVVQHELLLRMREPDGAIVGPAAYLHVAEQYGLIGDIDRWVIERGVAIAAGGLPVEINLSARSVGDQGILDHIERCIADSGADPVDIVFEITETAIVDDQGAALAFAERLRMLGCKLALDDFGTGYGGFTYLKQLPVDCLKIDIEFVRDLVTNPGSRHVVQAVVALARGFDLQTVAEGVEDAETLELLRELGVDRAQGYHIARPGPLQT